jgi:hypothetical protein
MHKTHFWQNFNVSSLIPLEQPVIIATFFSSTCIHTSILSNLIILRIYDSDIAELIFKHNGISEIRLFYTYDNHVVS